ncbi:hypothetical protein Bca52824_017388 [Brassica carinata]|uniref:Uncharacterized protein n=1 Tax=Brassica carinata TaxID=52824 RepID=A0A8X7VMV7_BRACI|nr:hypothetical protein Bca52824_017388 [Brassica carinata]
MELAVVVFLLLVEWWWVPWHGSVRVSVSADLRSVSPLLLVISGRRVWALSVSGEFFVLPVLLQSSFRCIRFGSCRDLSAPRLLHSLNKRAVRSPAVVYPER